MATWAHASRTVALWRKRQSSRIGIQLTPSQRPSSWTAHPNRKHHRGDRAITPNTSSQRPSCWQCVQSNPKPCRQPCGFLLVILFPNPSFSCVNMRPFLWSVAAETRYEAEITETAKHTAPESKTNHASIHSSCETPWNCIMTRF